MIQQIVLLLLVIFAVITVQTDKLRRAAVYMGVFSLLISVCFLFYSAPDAALAEAVIGCALSMILYLVALQKYRVFTVYYTDEDSLQLKDSHMHRKKGNVLKIIENYCAERELEPHIILTAEKLSEIDSKYTYDVVIRKKDNISYIYAGSHSYQVDMLRQYLEKKQNDQVVFMS